MLGLNSRRANSETGENNDDVLKPLVEDEPSSIEIASSALNFASGSLDRTLVHNKSMALRIKSSYGDNTIDIQGCPETTSVAKLKSLVKEALEQQDKTGGDTVQDRHLRLICKGKLLSPDESMLSEFKVLDEDVVHAVLGKKEEEQPQRRGQRQHAVPLLQHQRRRRQRQNRGIGTIVGPGGRVTRAPRHGQESDEDSDDLEQGRERRGFDRLRGAGMSRQEITAIRSYFNRHVERYIQSLQQQQQQQNSQEAPPAALHLDEPDLSRRRLLVEEEWMQTQGATSEFRLNLNQNTLRRYAQLTANMPRGGTEPRGNDRDFLWGFCLGFFVGVIGLVWVWMPTISHKQKLGILTGICFQILLETKNIDESPLEENYQIGN